MTIPGIGPVGATALAASVTDPHQFRSGRQFAAWLGLTPLQKSSGGKERLGRITQDGRQVSAQAAGRRHDLAGAPREVASPRRSIPAWRDLLARKPARVATVALANKTARIVWAIMARGEIYRTGHAPALAA